jgi:hypothetical protein
MSISSSTTKILRFGIGCACPIAFPRPLVARFERVAAVLFSMFRQFKDIFPSAGLMSVLSAPHSRALIVNYV